MRASILVLWVWLLLGVAASAQAPATEPSAANREAAREAYSRGQALFATDRFVDAKAAFGAAYAAVPNPVVLLSIAECELRLGLLEDAYATFERYLSARKDAPDRAEVEQKLASLLATEATLVVTSQPAGAAIKLDGADTGKVTPAELKVGRGDHRLELGLSGYVPASDTIAARIGARHEIQVTLQTVPPPPLAASVEAEPEASASEPPTTALWITGVVGAAGIVTGTVLGFLVLAERSDFDAKPNEASADRGERLALFADVAFGVGAMALITGAVLYLTAEDGDAESIATRKAPSLQLSPALSYDGAGLAARGRF